MYWSVLNHSGFQGPRAIHPHDSKKIRNLFHFWPKWAICRFWIEKVASHSISVTAGSVFHVLLDHIPLERNIIFEQPLCYVKILWLGDLIDVCLMSCQISQNRLFVSNFTPSKQFAVSDTGKLMVGFVGNKKKNADAINEQPPNRNKNLQRFSARSCDPV